jgi:hypothetical protein
VQVASADNGAAAMLLTDTNQAATGAAAVAADDDDDNNSSGTTADTAPEVSADQSLSVAQGKSAVITVTATDADGDQLTFAPSNPAIGTLGTTNQQPGQYTCTSDANFVGTDTFTVTVSDEDSNTVTRTITVEVTKAALVNTELTTGQDTVQGTAADETINAAYGGAATPTTTFTPFDTIDGGAGTDTLNIYTTATANTAFPANATVENVEIVNVYNDAAAGAFGDASKFVGVTQLNQLGAKVANVTNLLATTTVGFLGTQQDGLNMTAQAAATSAAVALTNANYGNPADFSTGITLNVSGTKLNAVTVAGTLAPSLGTTAAANPAALDLAIAGDAAATALTVNTAVKSSLSTNAAMVALTSVDASASTGNLTYTGATGKIATIKTGSGADLVTLQTATTANINASLETGAGKDAIIVNTGGVGKTTVSSGDGDDTITVSTKSTGGLAISAGGGDDVIKGAGAELADKTTVDGGAGIDTLELSTTVLTNAAITTTNQVALLASRVSNVEQLKFIAQVTALDASILGTQFSQLEFDTITTNTVTNVSAAQKIVAKNIDITAKDYVATNTVPTPDAPPTGAVLNITSVQGTVGGTAFSSDIEVNGGVVNLTVATKAGIAATDNTTTLSGDFATANVNLVSTENVVAGSPTTDNIAAITYISVGTAAETMVITGEGSAAITNTANVLTSVDASGLGNTLANGDISAGLTYTAGTNQETIKLSAANDVITTNSFYGVNGNTIDTISGFDAVNEAAGAKGSTDIIGFGTAGGGAKVILDGDTVGEATKLDVTSESSIEGAFLKAAVANNAGVGNVTFFQFGGDTYLFQNDSNNGLLDANDFALKVTGLVAFDTAFNSN